MAAALTPELELKSTRTCECDIRLRSACRGEGFYKEFDGKRYCVLHFPGNEKNADFCTALHNKLDKLDFNFRGVWFPDDATFFNFDFSAKADFRGATFSAKADFAESNFREMADFSGTTFIGEAEFFNATVAKEINFAAAVFTATTDFSGTTFIAAADFFKAIFMAQANFSGCTFKGKLSLHQATFVADTHFGFAKFEGDVEFTSVTFGPLAYFVRAAFSGAADFSDSRFNAVADFNHSSFGGVADFSDCTFNKKAVFGNATFRADVYFADTTFEAEAHFTDAVFADYLKISGDVGRPAFSALAELDLQFARFNKPDHVSFHTLTLRPYWFVNVDARKFDLTNVDWDWRNIQEDIRSLQTKLVSSPHRLLAIACRYLAVNAEESQRYGEASRFRYRAMDAKRRTEARGFPFWKLSWWYWLASGYGERVLQAFMVLLGIWLLSGLLYTQVGFVRWEPRLASETDIPTATRDNVGAPMLVRPALTYQRWSNDIPKT